MPNYQHQDGRQITAADAETAWRNRRAARKAAKKAKKESSR